MKLEEDFGAANMAKTKLAVKVQPGASRNEIVGFVDGALKVRLMAPPVEGKANAALLEVLASALGVRKRDIQIIQGTTGRDKLVVIDGLDSDDVRQLLNEYASS